MSDKNNLVYQDQLDDNVIEMLSEDIGSNYSLITENTRAVVGALNEIKGKDIISNAVGSPLVFDDTFEVMGEKIDGLTNNFKAKLLNLGVSVSSIDKFEALIGKLDEIDIGVDAEELLGPFIESLSGILEDEGVELSGNETLGELIIKVDEEFDRKNSLMFLHSNIEEIYATRDYYSNGPFQSVVIIKEDGSIYACGDNSMGQLGFGYANEQTSIFRQLELPYGCELKQISIGNCSANMHILGMDNKLYGCGTNTSKCLGMNSDTNYYTSLTAVTTGVEKVFTGNPTFIVKTDGTVWSSGSNTYGEMAIGQTGTFTSYSFMQVTNNISDWKEFISGNYTSFMLKTDGTVWMAGYVSSDQIYTKFTKLSGTAFTNVKQFCVTSDGASLGSYIYASLCNDGTVYHNGSEVNITDVDSISMGSGHLMMLKSDGTLWAKGSNTYGQLGLDDTSISSSVVTQVATDVKKVVCGKQCTYILKNDGTLWACGNNSNGNLGIDDTTTYSTSFVQSCLKFAPIVDFR